MLFAHDHTSGPRGAAMKWSLDKFAQKFPHIEIKFRPQPNTYFETFAIQIAAGVQAEVALLGEMIGKFIEGDVWRQINGELAKHPDFDPGNYYYMGDTHSANLQDTLPQGHLDGLRGPMFGMPFQGNTNGNQTNVTMMEKAGVEWPTKGNWALEGQFLDDLRKATDAEIGQFGLRPNQSAWIQWAPWAWALADDPNLMYRDADENRLTVFDSGGDRGLRLLTKMIHEDKVAHRLEDSKQLSGEFGDPFSAGKVMISINGGAVGSLVSRIKDRFSWSMAPMQEGPRGAVPHEITDQPHLITNTADTRGNVDEVVELLMFWSGPEVQGRIGVDRGSMPIRKDVIQSKEFHSGPPDRHDMWATYLHDQLDPRSRQFMHPDWAEWWSSFRDASDIMTGDVSVDEGIAQRQQKSDRILKAAAEDYEGMKAHVRGLKGF